MRFTSVEFCDTNVCVYAYERSTGLKREVAQALLDRLWMAETEALSVQVLQELYVALTRQGPSPLPPDEARALVAELTSWRVFEPTKRDVLEAIGNAHRWQVSFWDSMLLTAANAVGAETL